MKLFAALVIAAERRLSEFKGQDLANTAWAFATVNHRDEKLFTVLAITAERPLSDVNVYAIQIALWASSQHEHVQLNMSTDHSPTGRWVLAS